MNNQAILGPVIIPSNPDTTDYCQVRFLNAAPNYFPLLISISLRMISSRLSYTEMTPYFKVKGSFCQVLIAESSNPLKILLRKSIVFSGGEIMTLAITNSTNGLQLIQVPDQSCSSKEYQTSCIRFVNLSYGSTNFDIKFENGELVFDNIAFTEITPYKKATSGHYVFEIYEYSSVIPPRDIDTPLLIFSIDIKESQTITIYLVGQIYMSQGLQSVTTYN